MLSNWLCNIRDVHRVHHHELDKIEDPGNCLWIVRSCLQNLMSKLPSSGLQVRRLVELNVVEQWYCPFGDKLITYYDLLKNNLILVSTCWKRRQFSAAFTRQAILEFMEWCTTSKMACWRSWKSISERFLRSLLMFMLYIRNEMSLFLLKRSVDVAISHGCCNKQWMPPPYKICAATPHGQSLNTAWESSIQFTIRLAPSLAIMGTWFAAIRERYFSSRADRLDYLSLRRRNQVNINCDTL